MLARTGKRLSVDIGRDHNDLRILKGVVSVMAFVLAAKAIGALKEIVVAARYGTGAPVDAYLLIFKLYDLPISVWAGALGITFVPLFFSTRGASGEFLRFRAELAGATLLCGLALGLLAAVGVPLFLRNVPFGLTPEVRDLAIDMAVPMAAMIPLGALMSIVFSRLIAAERRVASLIDGVPALVLLGTLLIVPGVTGPLIWGTVIGYAAALAMLLATEARIEPLRRPVFSFQSPQWKSFLAFTLVVGAAGFVLSATAVIDQVMVAHLAEGAIAELGYASRIIALIVGIGATAITRVILPVLSDVQTTNATHAWEIASRWAALLLVLGAVALVIGWIAAPTVVRLMFERGAFTADDTASVAEILRYGLFQLPFYFSSVILAQLWAARGKYLVFLFVNCAAVGMKLVANAAFIGPFGVNGVMIGTAVMYATCLFILWQIVPRFVGNKRSSS